ncbi:MAG: tRNA1(Val) (adenine(37)-N6)-methyltransferase [Sediminibacterium sp.]
MPNDYFQFQQFRVEQVKAAMKVCTDACIFGAWVAQLLGQQHGRLLDIGTGTGLLALMVAQQTGLKIDAIDIRTEAVDEAGNNFRSSPWSDRLNCFHGDIRRWRTDESYDAVICNPPFYENNLRSTDDEKNDAMHSERLTLEELVQAVNKMLKPGGGWGILLPHARVGYFLDVTNRIGWKLLHRLDVYNEGKKEPFRSCMWLGKEGEATMRQQLTIKQSGIYTEEFRTLLGSYYLAFQG